MCILDFLNITVVIIHALLLAYYIHNYIYNSVTIMLPCLDHPYSVSRLSVEASNVYSAMLSSAVNAGHFIHSIQEVRIYLCSTVSLIVCSRLLTGRRKYAQLSSSRTSWVRLPSLHRYITCALDFFKHLVVICLCVCFAACTLLKCVIYVPVQVYSHAGNIRGMGSVMSCICECLSALQGKWHELSKTKVGSPLLIDCFKV